MLLVCLALNQALILHGRAEGGAAFVNASSNSNKALGKKSCLFFFFFPPSPPYSSFWERESVGIRVT